MKWIKKLFCGNTEATPSNIEAHKDEIKVPVSFLSAQNIVYAGEEVGLSRLAFKAKQLGNKYVTIDRNIYYQALNNIAKGRRLDYSIQRSAKLNLLGIRYEKEGNIEDAVKVYEENIAMRSNGYLKQRSLFNAEKRPYFRASSLCSIKYPSAKQNAVKWKFGKNKEGVARCYSFFSSVSSSSAIASVSACQRSIAAAFRS